MLDLKQIESFYPENLRVFKKSLLREYLQYKILEIIYDSKFGDKLSLMGGTAIHIIHQNNRFSEDIDFDNFGLERRDFEQLSELIQRRLKLEGYVVEIRTTFKRAYCCYIRIKNVLFESELSGHKEENLLIQLDTEPQKFEYPSDAIIINKFDVFLRIKVVPVDILLSQKLYAIFSRKRAMGRDFYDTVFLLGKTNPNLDYLKLKLKIIDMEELKKKLLFKCRSLNFKQLSKDVEPFLFISQDSKKVLFFCDYIKDINWQ